MKNYITHDAVLKIPPIREYLQQAKKALQFAVLYGIVVIFLKYIVLHLCLFVWFSHVFFCF